MNSDSSSRLLSSDNSQLNVETIGTSLAGDSAKNAMADFFRMSESATEDIGEILNTLNLRLCVAESCTGGLLGAAITQVSGVSSWFEGGFITYSNKAKHENLGVDAKTLEKYGAVSALTVCQMAAGACRKSNAEIGISISGIAGPLGAVKDKPVGTVWIGLMLPKNFNAYKKNLESKKEQLSKINAKVTAANGDSSSEKSSHGSLSHGSLPGASLSGTSSPHGNSPNKDYSWLVSAQLLKNAYFLRETPRLILADGEAVAREFHFEGDRTSVRQSATLMALYFAYEYLSL